MKKSIKIGILLAAILSICVIVKHQKKTVNKLKVQNKQNNLIFNQIKHYPNNTQLAIAFVTNDSTLFLGALKQNDTVKQIQNSASLFEIGSITKVFTTTLLADLVLDSILTLDDDISTALNTSLHKNVKISFKVLANHTSGLPRKPSDWFWTTIKAPLNPNKYYHKNKLDKYVSEILLLKTEPGTTYKYSNLGMGILGYALCQLTEKDYEALLQEKIFSKYKMDNTTSHKKFIRDKMVQGLGPFGNPTPSWELASLEAAGNIASSTIDLSKFMRAQFNPSNLELALTRKSTFAIRQNKEIGLGWHILKDKSKNNWYFHNGGTGGYRSAFVFDPILKKGVIILSNISIGHWKSDQIDELCFKLMNEN